MESKGFAIRTRHDFQRKFVISKDKELNLQNYLDQCGKTFFIKSDQKVEMFFDHTLITKEDFEFIVKKGSNCASFYIHLVTTPNKTDEPVFTLSELEAFIISKNAGNIIEKGRSENLNSQITESERKTLVSLAHDYLCEKCTKVDRFQMASVAKLLVFLIPKLQDSKIGEHTGYSVILDFLAKKFRNVNYTKSLQTKRKSNRRSRSNAGQVSFTDANSSKINHSAIDNVKNDLNFFKAVVVTEENMDMIKQKLKSTIEARAGLVKDAKLDFLEQYPIFFTHPILILEDFLIRYSDKANPNALIEKWPNYSGYAKDIATKQFKSGPLRTGWAEDIESFLVFLKLLPAKSGKNTGSVLPFSLATDKFIVHSDEKPLQKDLDKNVYPHIVAVGPSKSNISRFFIVVENHLIDVPIDWNTTQTVDLFFKIHLVFDIKFEVNISPTMVFFARFVYGFKSKSAFKPTLTMTNLDAKITMANSLVPVVD